MEGLDLDERNELGFAYSRERLNVAVSRAKKKCVLLCSPAVLHPPMAVIESAETRAGFELMQRICDACVEAPTAAERPGDYAEIVAQRRQVSEVLERQPGAGADAVWAALQRSAERCRLPDVRAVREAMHHCVRYRHEAAAAEEDIMAADTQLSRRSSDGSSEPASQTGGQLASYEVRRSCSIASQEADEDEDEADEMEVEGEAPPAAPEVPELDEISPTEEDERLLRRHHIGAAAQELCVPLLAVCDPPRGEALLASKDWPSLVELPACVRGWRAQGFSVRPVSPSEVDCDWYTEALHAKVRHLWYDGL